MYAIEITDDDGDDEESNVTGTEDETMAAGFIRQNSNHRNVAATRRHVQSQGSARITTYTSKYHHAKRDRSDSYDDDFVQPKLRTPYRNSRSESAANTRASAVAPVVRELIEIHDTDSEDASSGAEVKYPPDQVKRERQQTKEYDTGMSSQHSGYRANSSSTFNDSHLASTDPSHSNLDANSSNNNSWFNWAKPARIAMSYVSNAQTGQSGQKDA
ncbi:hypothetical protein BG000_009000 [Podila horticola]|nr:hypothetical protein BG000_009000 [Podila horticola]